MKDKPQKGGIILCAYCDADDHRAIEVLGVPDRIPWRVLTRDCVADWLKGQALAEGTGQEFRYLAVDETMIAYKSWRRNQLRYLHYRGVANLLGATGERFKLPGCVYKEIADRYPDEEGAPTKVGFKRPRCTECNTE